MKDLTEIVCVLDRSGSMESIVDDAIGGFNTFLKSQQETPGEAVMSIVLFDHEYLPLYSGKPVAHIPPFNRQTFVPRGNTALFDALGKTIKDVGARLAALPETERPNKVLFVILTDGHENDSRKYSRHQINEMITHQRNVYKWEFLFLAANQDAFAVSTGLGISRGNAMNFLATPDGTTQMFSKVILASKDFRTMKRDSVREANLFAYLPDEEQTDENNPNSSQSKI